jgi:cation:H+ antiporter
MLLICYLLATLVFCWGIYKSCNLFESSTEYLGRNMSNGVKGASLNAVASSMPELLTSFLFLFNLDAVDGYAGTIGTTAGSAVFNALIIPSLVIFFVYKWRILNKETSIPLSQYVVSRDGIFLILAEFLLLITILTGEITWIDGLGLMLLYVVYSAYLYKDSKKADSISGEKKVYIPSNKKKLYKSIWNLILSISFMTVFCWGLVYCVEGVGHVLNIELLFTSVILAAAASSVPDMMISLKDAKAGNYDDAIANALGSNIFDICIAHGLPLFIYTLMYGSFSLVGADAHESNILRITLLVVTTLSILVYRKRGGVNKTSSYLLILLYLGFLGIVGWRLVI